MKVSSRVLASTVLCLFLPAAVPAAAQGVFGSFKAKVKEKMTADPYANAPASAAQPSPTEATSSPASNTQEAQAPPPVSIAAYQNYDFVPGEVVIFADDFTNTQDGEFPVQWDLKAGQAVVNRVSGWEALLLTDGNSALVNPRMKVPHYLPAQWTLEFDTYANPAAYPPKLFFYDGDNEGQLTVNYSEAGFVSSGADLIGSYPAALGGDPYKGQWHHIAIAVRGMQLKLYVDQFRVLTVPDMHMQPQNFTLGGIGQTDGPITVSNFRLATGGGMNLVGKKFTDAKIVTHAINFDVDRATIRPESMGALNQIKSIMAADPSLKFEIDGHTDNSGNAAHNQQLSEQRAAAVQSQLISMGIQAARLTTKGFGDTKPLNPNTTPEGKANNRRVEFVRM